MPHYSVFRVWDLLLRRQQGITRISHFFASLLPGCARDLRAAFLGEERLLHSTFTLPAPGKVWYCDIMPVSVTTTAAGNSATGRSVSEVVFSKCGSTGNDTSVRTLTFNFLRLNMLIGWLTSCSVAVSWTMYSNNPIQCNCNPVQSSVSVSPYQTFFFLWFAQFVQLLVIERKRVHSLCH